MPPRRSDRHRRGSIPTTSLSDGANTHECGINGSHDSGVPGDAGRPRARGPRSGAEPRARPGAGRGGPRRGRRRSGDERRSARRPATTIRLLGRDHPWASRGGLKLAPALDAFGIDCAGRVCLDAGASTGGFTDVLLSRGAAFVYAVDVGRGQLDPRLATDPRVRVMDRTNLRSLDVAPRTGARPGHARPLVHLAAPGDAGGGASHRAGWRGPRRPVQAAVRARPRRDRQGRHRSRPDAGGRGRGDVRRVARVRVRRCARGSRCPRRFAGPRATSSGWWARVSSASTRRMRTEP